MTNSGLCYVSTWEVPCGIASFTAALRQGVADLGVGSEVLVVDRPALVDLSRAELARRMTELGREAAQHRVVHVQHEFGFFAGAYGNPESIANFGRFLSAARQGAERILITFHSMPPLTRSWSTDGLRAAAREQALSMLWRRRVASVIDGRQVIAVAPSRYQRRVLIDSGIDPAAVVVVGQGAPALQPAAPSRDDAREALGVDAETHLILQFGFVAEYKGHLVTLDALHALPKDHHLVVVGGVHPHGSDLAYDNLVARMLASASVARRVRVTGWVPDAEVAQWFAAADVCVAPYVVRTVPTSAAAMWALASGRPVIASRIPAFQELVTDWDCAELVTPGSAYELAEAIVRLRRDERRSKELVASAERACASWTWWDIAEQHTRLYGLV